MSDNDLIKMAKVANVLKKVPFDKFGKISKYELKSLAVSLGSGITLTNNEIRDIKVINSLENRGILLKLEDYLIFSVFQWKLV